MGNSAYCNEQIQTFNYCICYYQCVTIHLYHPEGGLNTRNVVHHPDGFSSTRNIVPFHVLFGARGWYDTPLITEKPFSKPFKDHCCLGLQWFFCGEGNKCKCKIKKKINKEQVHVHDSLYHDVNSSSNTHCTIDDACGICCNVFVCYTIGAIKQIPETLCCLLHSHVIYSDLYKNVEVTKGLRGIPYTAIPMNKEEIENLFEKFLKGNWLMIRPKKWEKYHNQSQNGKRCLRKFYMKWWDYGKNRNFITFGKIEKYSQFSTSNETSITISRGITGWKKTEVSHVLWYKDCHNNNNDNDICDTFYIDYCGTELILIDKTKMIINTHLGEIILLTKADDDCMKKDNSSLSWEEQKALNEKFEEKYREEYEFWKLRIRQQLQEEEEEGGGGKGGPPIRGIKAMKMERDAQVNRSEQSEMERDAQVEELENNKYDYDEYGNIIDINTIKNKDGNAPDSNTVQIIYDDYGNTIG